VRQIPSDTTALVNVKVARLRNTGLYRKYIAKQVAPLELGDDVQEMLALSNGKESRIFWKDKTKAVEWVADRKKVKPGLPSGAIPPVLREMMRSIPAENQIWGVGVGSSLAVGMLPETGNLANLRNLFQALESWTVAADLTSGVKAEASGIYRTEQDAKQIHDALRGLMGLARLSTPSESPELLRLYDGIQISMEKNTVRVKADIAADLVDAAAERLPRGQR
jgi:hypothetical protein